MLLLCNAKIRRERKKLYHNDITTQSTQSYNHIRQEECTGRRLAPNLCIHTFSSSFSSLSVWRRHMTVFGSRAIIQHTHTLTQTQTVKPRRKKMHYVCTTTSEHFEFETDLGFWIGQYIFIYILCFSLQNQNIFLRSRFFLQKNCKKGFRMPLRMVLKFWRWSSWRLNSVKINSWRWSWRKFEDGLVRLDNFTDFFNILQLWRSLICWQYNINQSN